jgi:hypothetical protein
MSAPIEMAAPIMRHHQGPVVRKVSTREIKLNMGLSLPQRRPERVLRLWPPFTGQTANGYREIEDILGTS